MKQTNKYLYDMLDMDNSSAKEDIIWRPGKPSGAFRKDDMIVLTVPFYAQEYCGLLGLRAKEKIAARQHEVYIRAYGDSIVRVTTAFQDELCDEESVMLEWHESLKPEPLDVEQTSTGWSVRDSSGNIRMLINTSDSSFKKWSDQGPGHEESFNATVFPDGHTPVEFMNYDGFGVMMTDSLPLVYVEREGKVHRTGFSLKALYNEKFAGTGERFSRMNLNGQTFVLENEDAAGVNSRRCYKNIPFYVSSQPYGMFMHSSGHIRLSLAGLSTRAACGTVEDKNLDLFFLGGGSIEQVIYNYRRVTGFPKTLPLWSFGIWMSRMSYFSADEVREVARKMREEGFPCDVINIDTAWFEKDWQCTWQFGSRFPEAENFLAEMREKGFRIMLWQLPRVCEDNPLYAKLKADGFLGKKTDFGTIQVSVSNFDEQKESAYIDFSNPKAVQWYKQTLGRLFKAGASVLQADFGEEIDMSAEYYGMPAKMLHNLYALLYQKTAFEIAEQAGEGMIWARSAWAGSQRYPLHWGGDSASSWDGLAGSIRGGLHLGLSGFAFWSHDVAGFHGVPDFTYSQVADDLYIRWTQVSTFTSHMRYHGANPREPYEYPAVADIARKWFKLRYALIPYFMDQSAKVVKTGLPIFRAMIFHHENDPLCWEIDDQFYCGEAFLIAPILNSQGVRNVYLPAGDWVDVWTGEPITGPRWLNDVCVPLKRLPLYAVKGSCIRICAKAVQNTTEIEDSDIVELAFDDNYDGLSNSVLGQVTNL